MADDERQGIGARIAAARREAGLTQRELADRLGVTTRSIQNYESGSIVPYKHLRRIEVLARRRVGWILSGDGSDDSVSAHLERLEQAIQRHSALLEEHLTRLHEQTALMKRQREVSLARRSRKSDGQSG